MDQITFEELLSEGELGLILMDGGKDLTKEQMARVKALARQQSREKLLQMSMDLANKPGYRDFMSLPLVSTIMSGRRKPETPEDTEKVAKVAGVTSPKKSAIRKRTSKTLNNKDPDSTKVSPGTARPLKFMDSDTDILGKMYNQMRSDRASYLKKLLDEDKFEKKLDLMKEDHTKELVDIFTGKTKVKQEVKGKKPEQEKQELKKNVEKEVEKVTAEKTLSVSPAKTAAKLAAEGGSKAVGTATKVIAGAALVGVSAGAIAKIGAHESGGNPNTMNIVSGHNRKEALVVKGNIDVTTGKPFNKDLTDMTIPEVIDLGRRRNSYYKQKGAGAAAGKYQFMPDTLSELAKQIPNWQSTKFTVATQEKLMEIFTNNNAQKLQAAGLPVSEASLHMMHFVGSTKTTGKLLNAPAETPMKDILGQAAIKANPSFANKNVGQYRAELAKDQSFTPIEQVEKPKAVPITPPKNTGNQIDSSSRENNTLKQESQVSGTPGNVTINTINNTVNGSTIYDDGGTPTKSVLEQTQFH
jgi:hypothetical protein